MKEREREVVVGLGSVRVLLAKEVPASFQSDHVHFTGLLVKAGSLIERTKVAGDGGGLLVVLAELRVHDFQGAEKVGLGGIEVAIGLGDEPEVVRHGGDVEEQRGLVFLEILDGAQPMADGLFLVAEPVVGSALSGMQAADLVEAVRAVLQLIDGLAVVLAGEFMVPELAVNVPAGFESGGEGVDAIEVGTEGLLGFFHRRVGRVERFREISCLAQGSHAVLKNADEGSGGRVHDSGD